MHIYLNILESSTFLFNSFTDLLLLLSQNPHVLNILYTLILPIK
jgi:hypothetical protein